MLYLICTPIGNLNDFSVRSINTLNEVDNIFVEDTRVSSKLLKHFNISKNTFSFHEHNEERTADKIIDLIKNGQTVAVLSDAGAPLISDPGYPLVQRCIKNTIPFTVIPGPSSVINSLLLSGLPTDKFLFNGFLPKKNTAKKEIILKIKRSNVTNIFFESAKRLESTVEILSTLLSPKTSIAICREMTKKHETIYRGTPIEILNLIKENKIKLLGEFVLLLNKNSSFEEDMKLDENFCRPFLDYLSPADASKLIAKITSFSKNDIYKFLLEISK
ncbi:MAG: 16S rRNA (cytidine(1402)-2'-O)-methyltransferase [Flavobacteriales bacterium]|nr:16S rRNA (cytidine(1402)-2'-O)-methyltransferase [Flavobacteriales bacterium]|tara:strand:- start:72 stop:893 length:822 start_codon:yes stop_codon:yes gene_type:complete